MASEEKRNFKNIRIEKIVYVKEHFKSSDFVMRRNGEQSQNSLLAPTGVVRAQQQSIISNGGDKKIIRLVPANNSNVQGTNHSKTVTLTTVSPSQKVHKSSFPVPEVILLPSPRSQFPTILPKRAEKLSEDFIVKRESYINKKLPAVIKVDPPKQKAVKKVLKSHLQRSSDTILSGNSPKQPSSGNDDSLSPNSPKELNSDIPSPFRLQNDLVRTLNLAAFQPLQDSEECPEDNLKILSKKEIKQEPLSEPKETSTTPKLTYDTSDLQSIQRELCFKEITELLEAESRRQQTLKKECDQSVSNVCITLDETNKHKDGTENKNKDKDQLTSKTESSSSRDRGSAEEDCNTEKTTEQDGKSTITSRNKKKCMRRKCIQHKCQQLQTAENWEDAMVAEAWELLKMRLVDYIHMPDEIMLQYQKELCKDFNYHDDAVTMVTDRSLYVRQLIEKLGS